MPCPRARRCTRSIRTSAVRRAVLLGGVEPDDTGDAPAVAGRDDAQQSHDTQPPPDAAVPEGESWAAPRAPAVPGRHSSRACTSRAANWLGNHLVSLAGGEYAHATICKWKGSRGLRDRSVARYPLLRPTDDRPARGHDSSCQDAEEPWVGTRTPSRGSEAEGHFRKSAVKPRKA